MKFLYLFTIMFYGYLTSAFAETIETKLNQLIELKQTKTIVSLEYNPFATKEMTEELKNNNSFTQNDEGNLELLSIINDKAFIGGKWYRVGEPIGDGKIVRILSSSVQIGYGSRIESIQFEKSKKLLHVKGAKK